MATPAEDRLKGGDLDGALAELTADVRRAPGDARLRVFLFQLLCLRGEWRRALVQLRTCATLDPEAETMARAYREAIACELWREEVFAGRRTPVVVGEPAPWTAWLVEALRRDAAGEAAAADALRAQAFEAAPATPGAAQGAPFAWIADADPRLGPVLEIVVDGRYLWAPFSALAALRAEPPADLRDRVWTPVSVTWAAGGETVGLVPTRYAPAPGATPAPAHRLAGATDWVMDGERVVCGLGQRLLVTDAAEHALMDLRALSLDQPAEAAAHG
ncbi:type VI secretion system accessory protein TagJ [Albimonas pacifica]|uniref:Type VI secretion system protein ImpE n=1 Tax=Albimonas pacifica TaxID=1114924 RepID=A0A1I3CZ09_9RHOB|nr:type VI secretion system accessory protein TagJ [Albimonas pacifica]SFH79695.1 type VI secretion system protein ImpE [Albimonas pacifica]